VAKFKYFEDVLTNQNYIHNEVKSRLNSWNVCYHSVENVSPHYSAEVENAWSYISTPEYVFMA